MTREEAVAILNHNVSACLHGTEWGEALDMVINSLKIDEMYDLESENADEFISRSVIEDIKAEIKTLAQEYDFYADTRRKYGLWTALEIIDKHCGKE